MDDQNKFIRLWIHETYRVFHDRLIDDDDRYCRPEFYYNPINGRFFRATLFNIVFQACYQNFRTPMDKACEPLVPEEEKLGPQHIRNLFFGNYIEPDAEPKIYDEVMAGPTIVIVKRNGYFADTGHGCPD